MACFTWEQVGGRCKLVDGEDFRSLTPEEVLAFRGRKQKAMRKIKESPSLEQERLKVEAFLSSRGFKDVNTPKVMYCGLKRRYALQQALREGEWKIMELLMKFGAKCPKP